MENDENRDKDGSSLLKFDSGEIAFAISPAGAAKKQRHGYKFQLVAEALRKKIQENLDEGRNQLPSQEKLCESYGVSRVTLRRALQQLEEEGFLTLHQGSRSALTGLSPQAADNRICLFLSNTDTGLYPAIYHSIGRAAVKRDYVLSLYQTGHDLQKERDLLQKLLETDRPPRGILAETLVPFPTPNADLYHELMRKGASVVFLAGLVPELCAGSASPSASNSRAAHSASLAGCVLPDYTRAVQNALAQLIHEGHESIGGIFNTSTWGGQACAIACLNECKTKGLPISADRFLLWSGTEISGIPTTRPGGILDSFLARCAGRCTALLCGSDEEAYAAASLLEQKGSQIPGDMSIISIGSSYLRSQSALHINSYALAEDFGEAVLAQLIRQMTGQPAGTTLLPWKYVPGNSLRSRAEGPAK